MVTIEFNDVKILVPQNWDDITLGEYEKFYAAKPEDSRARVALIAQICKIDAELLLSWPAHVFNVIVGYTDFLFGDSPVAPSPLCEIDGVKYVVPVEDELSLGAWVDADEAQKKGPDCLAQVLAIVCRPIGEEYNYKNNDERAQMFAAQPVSKVLGVMSFFLHCKIMLDQHTQTCGNLRLMLDQLPRNIEIFQSLGSGIKLLRIRQVLIYWISTVLLRYQLRRFLRFYNTGGIKNMRKKHNENLTVS